MAVAAIKKELKKHSSPSKAEVLARFFKTGKGEYGEGDVFLGVTTPDMRRVAARFKNIPLADINLLLASPIHEERALALSVLVGKYQRSEEKERESVFRFYLSKTRRINNWDLVDLSCHHIVGSHVFEGKRDILYKLVRSRNLWERRIAIVSTLFFIRNNDLKDTFKLSALLLNDEHDLIHKAAGWMLREAGKRDVKKLENFLRIYCRRMPRTMLRYAIEKFPQTKRQKYLAGKI